MSFESITATISVNVDVELGSTDAEVDNDARGVLIDLLRSGADITITRQES